MTTRTLSGEPVKKPPPGRYPARTALAGRHVRLEPLDAATHAADLYACSHDVPGAAGLWTYMGYGPFADTAAMGAWLRDCAAAADPVFYALCDVTGGRAAGMASYLNIRPKDGVYEVGHIWFSPVLQRSTAASEAIYLMMAYAFDTLGCRRLEWKCDALNARSRAAALRFGFGFEGVFYRHLIVKGRNRDTAWFSMLAEEWPPIGAGFRAWLEPANFDTGGQQRTPLAAHLPGSGRA